MIKVFSLVATLKIKKIMDNLKQKYNFANLKQIHIDFINDQSYFFIQKQLQISEKSPQRIQKGFFHKYNYKSQYTFLKKSIYNLIDRLPIFIPSHKLKMTWDFIVCLSMLLFFFIIPVQIASS